MSPDLNLVPEVKPIRLQTEKEQNFFSQALLKVVPKDKQDSPEVALVIGSLYKNYYSQRDSARALALAVFQFCELTRATYITVANAIFEGTQKQISKSYISKLYHAGKVLTTVPIAYQISDIEKLAFMGRLSPEEILATLKDDDGHAMIGIKFVGIMTREDFSDILVKMYPKVYGEPKFKTWEIKAFEKQCVAAMKANSLDTELNAALSIVMQLLIVRSNKIALDKISQFKTEKLSA